MKILGGGLFAAVLSAICPFFLAVMIATALVVHYDDVASTSKS